MVISNPKTVGGTLTVGNQLGKFTFINNGTEAINLNTLGIVDPLSANLNGATLTVYDAARGVALGAGVVTAVGQTAISLNANSMRIDPGTSKSVSVRVSTLPNGGGYPYGGSVSLRVIGSQSNFILFNDYGVVDAQTYLLDNSALMDQVTIDAM